jgi:uncharacterized iron-regulated membrane protein
MKIFLVNRSWLYRIHRWVSLLCAAFFLLLCITGLPLLFKDEIATWNIVTEMPEHMADYADLWNALPSGKLQLSQQYPQKVIKAISADAEKGQLLFRVENPGELQPDHARMKMGGQQLGFDPTSNIIFDHTHVAVKYPLVTSFMHWMHILHLRLGLGQEGMMFLGLFCALSAGSIFSGLILYWPMMTKISWGTIRNFSKCLFLADSHKFIGMIAGIWSLVLCISGTMIVVFSIGYGSYLHTIEMQGNQYFSKLPSGGSQRSFSEAMRWIQQTYPDRNLLSVEYPEQGKNYYAFYLTPDKATKEDFMGQKVLLNGFDATDFFYTQPLPKYLLIAAVFLNFHIHNHPTLFLKMLWLCYLILTMGTIISGLWIYFEKKRKKPIKKVHITLQRRNNLPGLDSAWKWPTAIFIFSIIGLIAPLLSNPAGIIIAEVALSLPLLSCLVILKKQHKV